MKDVKRDRTKIWRYLVWSVVIGAVLGGISGAFLVALTPKMHEATVELKTTDALENVAARFESRKVRLAAASVQKPSGGSVFFHTEELQKMLTVETDAQQQVVRLKVKHTSDEMAQQVALDFIKGYEQVMEWREKTRAEAQQKRWQMLRSQWLAQLEVLEPGRDQARIDELVRKISLVSALSTRKSPVSPSDIALTQAPLVKPVVRTWDHLATMGMGALRGVLWCVGLCLLWIAALPSVLLPAKSSDEAVVEEELKGSSWLDTEALRE